MIKDLKSVWVLETPENFDFVFKELDLLAFLASVTQWATMYPESRRILFCTSNAFKYLETLEMLDLWDEVDVKVLDEPDQINRSIFWAACKLKALRHVEAPFVVQDCDFYFKKKILDESHFEFDVIVNHLERFTDAIFLSNHPLFIQSRIEAGLDKNEGIDSYNVAFLYMKDEEFRKEYVNKAYKLIEIMSDNKELGFRMGQMHYCEQKTLFDLCSDKSLNVETLLPYHTYNEDVVHLGSLKDPTTDAEREGYAVRREEVFEIIKTSPHREKIFKAWKINNTLKGEGTSTSLCYLK